MARFFRRKGSKGHVRRKNVARHKEEGSQVYKKGYEVRLLVRTEAGLNELCALLERLEFKPGRPFAKGRQIALPIYGRAAVERFLRWMGET